MLNVGDLVQVNGCRSFANVETNGWIGYISQIFFEGSSCFVLIMFQGEHDYRLYNKEDLTLIKGVGK